MASSIPNQSRAVDPYASYNSNVVNQLTGIVTRGVDALDYYNSLQVISDSTSSTDHVEVQTGIVYKDDMLIEITSPFRVDFTDTNHYYSAAGNPFNTEAGIYYIVLQYVYVKSRPAPQANIKILLPSQTSAYRAQIASGSYSDIFFLKAVEVTTPGGLGQIDALYDYDPDNPTTQREYLKKYTGTEIILPTFQAARDRSRLVYASEEDKYYFGFENGWQAIGGGTSFGGNTTAFEIGDLIYVTSLGTLDFADGTYGITTADGVVTTIGAQGNIQTSGKVEVVKVDPAASISKGGLIYLSKDVPGTVTDEAGTQFVGRCKEIIDSTSIIALFTRGEPKSYGSDAVSQIGTLDATAWINAGALDYQEIDVTDFKGVFNISIWDTATAYQIQPSEIRHLSTSVARVYMPAGFATTVSYCIVGPAL